jgi:hypothetical protein
VSEAPRLERYPAADDRTVEALLASVHAPCTAQQLACALDWTLLRTTAALHRLDMRLASTGQTLQQLSHQTYALAPRAGIVDRAQMARCACNRSQRIDPVTAGVLHRALTRPDGQRTRDQLQSADEHAAADRLIAAGILEEKAGTLRPTRWGESTFGIRPSRNGGPIPGIKTLLER